MRTRSIFDIFDFLNSVHFVLQNKSSNVWFIYWIKKLLRCEIDEIARNFVILSDLILILKVLDKVFFKKNFRIYLFSNNKMNEQKKNRIFKCIFYNWIRVVERFWHSTNQNFNRSWINMIVERRVVWRYFIIIRLSWQTKCRSR